MSSACVTNRNDQLCFAIANVHPINPNLSDSLLKSPKEMASYHPTSLMFCINDLILCKELATQIETDIPHLMSNCQNGYVQGRKAFHDTRRLK